MSTSIAFAALALFLPRSAGDHWQSFEREDGRALHYAMLMPADFDPAQRYPLVVALPSGAQDQVMVERGLGLYWRQVAAAGFLVASPAALVGEPSWQAQPAVLIELLEHLEASLPVAGKPCLAGVANGARAAFALALEHPRRFSCLVAMPGTLAPGETDARLARLRALPIALFVGGDDEAGHAQTQELRERLLRAGAESVHLGVFAQTGNVLPGSIAPLVIDFLRAHAVATPEASVRAVLDDFHEAAAAADGPRYFAHFSDDAVFLGTDATERWDVAAFKAYAEPHFSQGRGWTYLPTERHVTIGPSGDTAWFDERLHNEKYGEVRGSGVLVRADDTWKIAQYNLAFPVPNDKVEAMLRLK